MKTIAFSLFAVGMVFAASAHAGFNGQQNIQGNQGHGNGAGSSQVGNVPMVLARPAVSVWGRATVPPRRIVRWRKKIAMVR